MAYASPHLLPVLFDPGHGLFAWAPLLLLAAAGLVLALVRTRGGDVVAVAAVLALALQAWINGSVESWTQAGAFGSRRPRKETAHKTGIPVISRVAQGSSGAWWQGGCPG